METTCLSPRSSDSLSASGGSDAADRRRPLSVTPRNDAGGRGGVEGLRDRPLVDPNPRQVHDEDASQIRQVARVETPTIHLGAPSTERQPDAETAAIGCPLLERGGNLGSVTAARQSPAFVLDLDEQARLAGSGAQRHLTVRAG